MPPTFNEVKGPTFLLLFATQASPLRGCRARRQSKVVKIDLKKVKGTRKASPSGCSARLYEVLCRLHYSSVTDFTSHVGAVVVLLTYLKAMRMLWLA